MYFRPHVALRAPCPRRKAATASGWTSPIGGFPISRENCQSTRRADSKLIPRDVFSGDIGVDHFTQTFMSRSPKSKSANLAEGGEVDLGIDTRRSGCAMTQVVADLLDTQALSNEPCCTSVSQRMRPAVQRLDVQGYGICVSPERTSPRTTAGGVATVGPERSLDDAVLGRRNRCSGQRLQPRTVKADIPEVAVASSEIPEAHVRASRSGRAATISTSPLRMP